MGSLRIAWNYYVDILGGILLRLSSGESDPDSFVALFRQGGPDVSGGSIPEGRLARVDRSLRIAGAGERLSEYEHLIDFREGWVQDRSVDLRRRLGVTQLVGVVLCLAFGSWAPSAQAATPVSGNQCKKKQVGITVSGLSCQKQGTKYIWSRSIPVGSTGSSCDPNYEPCVPISSDVDCAGGTGNGPAYVRGPVRVVGVDIYGLDRDGNGVGCESG